MELKYLETVIAVAEYRSFSRAAEAIPCSQASVSRQIGAVEQELGYPIFERSTKSGSVQLTEKGVETLEQIRSIIDNCNILFGKEGKTSRVYRLGIFAGPFGFSAKSIVVSQFFIKCPELHLKVEEVRRNSYLKQLTQAKIDGMLIYETYLEEKGPTTEQSFEQGGLSYTLLRTQYPFLAVSSEHRFAGRESVSFRDLRDETFLLDYDIVRHEIRGEDVSHQGFLRDCQRAGFTPKVATLDVARTDLSNVRNAVIKERGWVYPTFQLRALHDDSNVIFVPIEDASFYAQYYFVTMSQRKSKNDDKVCAYLKSIVDL